MQDVIAVLGAEAPGGWAIAKKLRMEHYAVQLVAHDADLAEIKALQPKGIILAGEAPENWEKPREGILALGVPVLSLGACTRALLAAMDLPVLGEKVVERVMPISLKESRLFSSVESAERWIAIAEPFGVPEGFEVIAESDGFPLAYGREEAGVYLLQFQIERNDPDGMAILLSFARDICACVPWWTVETIIETAEKAIRDAAGNGSVICAMSGGVDSTVAAVLAGRALQERILCVFIDTGLMREGEADEIERYFAGELSLNFRRVDASRQVLSALGGVFGQEEKGELIDQQIKRALVAAAEAMPGQTVFVKGTHHDDTFGRGQAARDNTYGPVVEPLCALFKDEVRMVGEHLGLSPDVLNRQPFPGMGLAARIHGEVTESRLCTLRRATVLFEEELREAGIMKRLSRHFAMLDSVGGSDAIILRAVQGHAPNLSVARLPHDLLERVAEKVLKELPGVSRVLYDATPGGVERL